jgi:hypothetical protein
VVVEFAVGKAVRRPVEPGFVPLPNGAFPPPIVLTVDEGFIDPVEVVELAGPLPDGVFVTRTTVVNMELVEFVLENVELVGLG